MRHVKYLTKGLLITVAEEGERHNFNRQIDPEILDDVTDERMPVTFCMTHRHADGEPIAPHARCFVTLRIKGEAFPATAIVDMTFKRFDSLPTIRFPKKKLLPNGV